MSDCDCAGRGCTGACQVRHPPLIKSMRYVVKGLRYGAWPSPTHPVMVQDVVYFLEKEIERAEKLFAKLDAERNPRGCED